MCRGGPEGMEAPRSPRPAPPDHENHNGNSKILGRNANGTMVVTAPPGNEAELQLYRVLQRASLLAYYDTLLEMGGDDVQQLCDAGEEEFLEIMALVGMASKPLHVRRFQKALQEWVTNPSLFQIPIVPTICSNDTPFLSCSPRLLAMTPSHPPILQRNTVASPENSRPMYSPSPGVPESSCGSNSSAPNASPVHNTSNNSNSKTTATATSTTTNNVRAYSPVPAANCPPSSGSSPSSVNCSPVQITPCLLEAQIQRLASAAERLSKHLPQLEPKPHNTKKKMCKDLEAVMMMPENDPKRMEEIRKYAAIYGRFDCKRKPEKPLTLHEVSVNEAAAQMCRAVPALLTRRDELFPLARQVVRLSGFNYAKGSPQISSTCGGRSRSESDGGSGGSGGAKRPRGEHGGRGESAPGQNKNSSEDGMTRGHGNDGDINMENPRHQYAASGIWTRVDSDDGDSRYSFSNSSTPPIQDQEDSRAETESEGTPKESKVRVVASSGDHIIAVANPALALSRTLMPKRECGSSLEDN